MKSFYSNHFILLSHESLPKRLQGSEMVKSTPLNVRKNGSVLVLPLNAAINALCC